MTNLQETYNEFIKLKVLCPRCAKEVHFSQIIKWGYEEGQLQCPHCNTLIKHHDADALDKTNRLAMLDKELVDTMIKAAVGGKLHSHPAADLAIWAALSSIEERFRVSTKEPLSYISRMFLVKLYKQMVENGQIEEIPIYQIQAPIPTAMDSGAREKVTSVQHYKRRKSKKKEVKQMGLSIGGGSDEEIQELEDLLK